METWSEEEIKWGDIGIYPWCIDVVEVKGAYLVCWYDCEVIVVTWVMHFHYLFVV